MSTVLSVERVSKKFCRSLRRSLWYGLQDIALELVPGSERHARLRSNEFWALDDVSFELGRGEALAVVGRNGAGKSTLLRLLYGLVKPDRGEMRLRGRVEALIELGTGINPLLTGRENVRIGAALRGIAGRKADALLELIVDFTELAEFIDTPVQSYSTGMKARLSYALAAHLKPDVLLVDEVLAVGDMSFQRKCARHMREYLESGGSLLLVSHSTWHIHSLCERGLLLDRGRVVFEGSATETLNVMLEQRDEVVPNQNTPSGPLAIDEVRVETPDSGTGGPMRVVLCYSAEQRTDVLWGFTIWTADQWVCIAGEHNLVPRTIGPGRGELSCLIPSLPLVAGRYVLRASLVDPGTRLPFALHGWHGPGTTFDVRSAATLSDVAKMTHQQLVTMHVEWS